MPFVISTMWPWSHRAHGGTAKRFRRMFPCDMLGALIKRLIRRKTLRMFRTTHDLT